MAIKINGRLLQYLAAISASILTGNVGMALVWSSPVLPELISDESPIGVKITEDQGSWIVSLLLIGSVCGNVFVGLEIDCFGRRGSLLISSIPIFICWILIMTARSVTVLYATRFVLGFFLAVPVAISVVYIGEISEACIRGRLSVMCMVMLEVGSVLAIVIGSYLSYMMLSLVSSIPPILFFITFYSMPESPYFYLKNKNEKSAEMSLIRLRGTEDVSAELCEIKKSIEKNRNGNGRILQLFTKKAYRKALFIIFGLKLLQQLSGAVAIQSYMKIIFQKSSTLLNPDISSILCVSVPIPTMIASSYLIDSFGRKLLYYVSTLGCTTAMIFEAIYFYLLDSNFNVHSISWLPVLGIFLSYLFKSLGISNLSYLILGELFPVEIKGSATTVTLLFGSVLSSLVALGFPAFSDAFGMGSSFTLFAICCFGGFLFVRFMLPETKGQTLGDIQFKLKSGTS